MKNMSVKLILLATFFTFAQSVVLSAFASGGDFVLAARGAPPSCAIEVVSKEPSAARAAQELSDYVAKMTGVRMPVAESAAASPRKVRLEPGDAELGTDGFELAVEGDTLHVRGGVRGILYGVYELFEPRCHRARHAHPEVAAVWIDQMAFVAEK